MEIYLQIIFLFLGIVLVPVGFLGGRWLWQKMAQSPLLVRMQKFIRPVGIIGTIAMFASTIACLVAVVVLPTGKVQEFVRPLIMGGDFLLAYLVGYDISILRKQKFGYVVSVPANSPDSAIAFRIRWNLVRKVFTYVFLVIFIPYLIVAVISSIIWYLAVDVLLIMVGGSLGYLFWEHLKVTGMLTGSFLKQLLFLSLATTGVMAFIYGLSIYVDLYPGVPDNLQILFISLALFTECMGWYMLYLPLNHCHLNTPARV